MKSLSFQSRIWILRSVSLICLNVVLLTAQTLFATIMTIADYHLGESDPGAVAGNTTNNTTVDSAGGFGPLLRAGSPTYSSNVPASNADGSVLSANLVTADNDYFTGVPAATLPVNNFGVQAWVNLTSTTGNQILFSAGGNNGYEVWSQGGNWGILNEGTALAGSGVAAVAGTWTNLALVRDAGVFTLYINGVATVATTAIAPATPTQQFTIGAEGISNADPLNGLVDEVRVFTFSPGAFQVSDLAYPTVPEPSSFLLSGIGLLTMPLVRRALRRQIRSARA